MGQALQERTAAQTHAGSARLERMLVAIMILVVLSFLSVFFIARSRGRAIFASSSMTSSRALNPRPSKRGSASSPSRSPRVASRAVRASSRASARISCTTPSGT
jgi:hypothetical protein